MADPVRQLMQNAANGYCSVIHYDKGDGKTPTERVIEPRRLEDGVNGLLVRAMQLEPKKGSRMFVAGRIVSVLQHETPITGAGLKFCDGEVASTKGKAAAEFTEKGLRVRQYAAAVREVVEDREITDDERSSLASLAAELNLTEGMKRASHAIVFAEHLHGAVCDDYELDPNEEERIEVIAHCLDELGWRPG